jgi:hypothetical protein
MALDTTETPEIKGERLPRSVQEIAEVIGREWALLLIGLCPRFARRDQRGGEQVVLYIPRTLKPDHWLVRVLGWHDAHRLVRAFGGELLKPGNCGHLYRAFRDEGIQRLLDEGVPIPMVAGWFEVSERHVRSVHAGPGHAANDESMEKPQEVRQEAANDNAAQFPP